jgi:hypothetical protein
VCVRQKKPGEEKIFHVKNILRRCSSSSKLYYIYTFDMEIDMCLFLVVGYRLPIFIDRSLYYWNYLSLNGYWYICVIYTRFSYNIYIIISGYYIAVGRLYKSI